MFIAGGTTVKMSKSQPRGAVGVALVHVLVDERHSLQHYIHLCDSICRDVQKNRQNYYVSNEQRFVRT